MSVATRNPFAILDENPSPPSPPPPPSQAAAPAPAPQSQSTRGRGRGGPASRGGRYYPRGGAAPASSTPTTEDQPAPEGKQPRRTDGERRDGREGRGRGRGAGGPRGRGRTFDKHSATGKTDSDKKVHNSWGGDDGETERKVEEAATVDAAAEESNAGAINDWAASGDAAGADAWGASAPDDPPATEGAEKPQAGERRERRGDKDEEEEDNTLTLDQYLAQQREKENALVPKLEVRKPNEGAGDDLFKDAAPLKKDEEIEYFAGKAKSAPKARTQKEAKVFIEIEARFERPNRGGRGGRGGDRGGERGRGERGRGRGVRGRGRGAANGASAVNVDDETAFPSLS